MSILLLFTTDLNFPQVFRLAESQSEASMTVNCNESRSSGLCKFIGVETLKAVGKACSDSMHLGQSLKPSPAHGGLIIMASHLYRY